MFGKIIRRRKSQNPRRFITSSFKNELFNDIVAECNSFFLNTGQNFSLSVRQRLESCKMDVRKEIVSRTGLNACSPLLMAVFKCNRAMVRYLLENCSPDVEQAGVFYNNPDVKDQCHFTPLQGATLGRDLHLVKLLLLHGANINALSSYGDSALQIACIEYSKSSIIEFLLKSGAEVNVRLRNGNTCLMECVEFSQKSAILIKYGADVNLKNKKGETALHLAVQANKFDTARLLLNNKADPHLMNNMNDDALRIACINSCTKIVKYLMRKVDYCPNKRAETWELLGSVLFYNGPNDDTFQFWKYALGIRKKQKMKGEPLPEGKVLPRPFFFNDEPEFSTLRELKRNLNDPDKLRNQSLFIFRRVLGICHYFTLEKLAEEAKRLFQINSYQASICFWRNIMHSLVHHQFLIRNENFRFINIFTKAIPDIREIIVTLGVPSFNDLGLLFHSCVVVVFYSTKISQETQSDSNSTLIDSLGMHFLLECVMNLLYMLFEAANSEREMKQVYYSVIGMVHVNIRSTLSQNNILHYFVDPDFYYSINASHSLILDIVKVILRCRVKVNARNKRKMTPLHVTSIEKTDILEPIVKLLLDHGACLHTPCDTNETPADFLKKVLTQDSGIHLMKYVTLKSLAAQVVVKYNLESTELPENCRDIIEIHK